MSETIPRLVKPMLDEYISMMQHELPGFLQGFYIHGSLALSAFNPQFSDIDFIATSTRRCTVHDVAQLKAIHQRINVHFPKWPLSGSYLQVNDLGKEKDEIAACPFFHEGVMHEAGHFEVNAVTWWLLKHRGITIVGPEPDSLDFEVEWGRLIAEMHINLNTYWVKFTRFGIQTLWMLADDAIQWVVLGVLRQFYSFREHDIVSKTAAGEYGLHTMPPRWHRLIQEALNIRRQHNTLYRFRASRAVEAIRFLQYVIQQCNEEFTRSV
jgi:hypothetical protein